MLAIFKKIFVLISILMISSCTSTKRISEDNLKKIRNATVQASNYNYPGFSVIGGLTTGLLGPFSQPLYYKNGKQLVAENKINNPNEALKNKLIEGMKEKFNIKPGGSNVIVTNRISATSFTDNSSIDDLIKTYPNSEYILDTNYKNIEIMYIISGLWYDLHAVVNTRLIETHSGKIIGENTCLYNSKDSTNESYTYDNLTNNNAKLVKDLLLDSVNKCSTEIMEKLF